MCPTPVRSQHLICIQPLTLHHHSCLKMLQAKTWNWFVSKINYDLLIGKYLYTIHRMTYGWYVLHLLQQTISDLVFCTFNWSYMTFRTPTPTLISNQISNSAFWLLMIAQMNASWLEPLPSSYVNAFSVPACVCFLLLPCFHIITTQIPKQGQAPPLDFRGFFSLLLPALCPTLLEAEQKYGNKFVQSRSKFLAARPFFCISFIFRSIFSSRSAYPNLISFIMVALSIYFFFINLFDNFTSWFAFIWWKSVVTLSIKRIGGFP